jgi:hypothetical protein
MFLLDIELQRGICSGDLQLGQHNNVLLDMVFGDPSLRDNNSLQYRAFVSLNLLRIVARQHISYTP